MNRVSGSLRLLSMVWLLCSTAVHSAESERAAAWKLQTAAGDTVRFPADAEAQPTVLMFWPSWCPFSRALQPYVQDIWEDYRDRGVKVWTINIRENADPLKAMKERGLSFPLLLKGDALIESYGIVRTPWVVVVDQQGLIRYTRPGRSPSPIHDAIEIRKTLNSLLGSAAVPIPAQFPPPYDLHLKKPEDLRDRSQPRTFEASEWVPWVDALIESIGSQEARDDLPASGPVTSGRQALKQARSLWTQAYGKSYVHDMAPFQAYRRGAYWVALGQGLQLPLGEGLVAVIEADSGRVIRLRRGKGRR